MNIIALVFFVLASPFPTDPPDPHGQSIEVEVVLSHSQAGFEDLDVIIGDEAYNLRGNADRNGALRIGIYKARLIKDRSKESFRVKRTYELLLPNNKTRKFSVTGQAKIERFFLMR